MDIPGYSVSGPAGFGARGAVTVTAEDGTPGVAVLVEDSYTERILSLRDLHSAHLPEVLDVVEVPDGMVAVILSVVPGPSLATVGQARTLTRGELVTVWRSVADGLAAMHARGLVHGDVSPGNVVIGPDGPVLLDILGHDGAEIGHRGHVAPEVERGESPSAASDVWSLGRALTWLSDTPEVRDAVGRALDEEPARRPTARAFSTWALALGDPEPVALPDSAALAGAHVRAGHEATDLLPQPQRRPHRWFPLAAATVGLVAAWSISRAGATTPREESAPADPTIAAAGADEAAVQLLARRDAALLARDVQALGGIFVHGSAAHDADRAIIEEMVEAGVEVEGYASQAEVRNVVEMAGESIVTVDVVTSAFERRAGEAVVDVPETHSCARLVLTGAPEWRIAEALPCGDD